MIQIRGSKIYNLCESLFASHRQLIIYGVIGACGATIDLLLYILIIHFTHIPPAIASFISVSAGILNNFILNIRHNFRVSDKLLHRFMSFYSIGLGGALLSSGLIVLLYDGLGVDALLAKIISIPPVVLLQFFLNKHLSFSEKPLVKRASSMYRSILGYPHDTVKARKLTRYLQAVIMVCLGLSLVIFAGVLLLQLADSIATKSLSFLTVCFLLALVLLGCLLPTARTKLLAVAVVLTGISVGLRVLSIPYLKLAPISDLAITYDYAVRWLHGPGEALHAFTFPHWGIYGLALRDWFGLFGASYTTAKLLNIGIFMVVALCVFIYLYKSPLKRNVTIAALFLVGLYPTYLLYINYLSGEYLFTGLVALAMIFLFLLDRASQPKHYFAYLTGLSLMLASAALLKQMAIIFIPLILLCVIYRLSKRNELNLLLPSLAVIGLIFILTPAAAYHRLEHYAKGPANQHLTFLYTSSGLSTETGGQLNLRYYKPYLDAVTHAKQQGILTQQTYIAQDSKLRGVVYDELADFWSLPELFDKKANFIWANDNNISFWFFTSDSVKRVYTKPLLDTVSKAFFMIISLLFLINIFRTLRDYDDDLVNLFSIFFVCLYVIASLVIEGQPRYRIVLVPSLIIGASGGLLMFQNLARQLPARIRSYYTQRAATLQRTFRK